MICNRSDIAVQIVVIAKIKNSIAVVADSKTGQAIIIIGSTTVIQVSEQSHALQRAERLINQVAG